MLSGDGELVSPNDAEGHRRLRKARSLETPAHHVFADSAKRIGMISDYTCMRGPMSFPLPAEKRCRRGNTIGGNSILIGSLRD